MSVDMISSVANRCTLRESCQLQDWEMNPSVTVVDTLSKGGAEVVGLVAINTKTQKQQDKLELKQRHVRSLGHRLLVEQQHAQRTCFGSVAKSVTFSLYRYTTNKTNYTKAKDFYKSTTSDNEQCSEAILTKRW